MTSHKLEHTREPGPFACLSRSPHTCIDCLEPRQLRSLSSSHIYASPISALLAHGHILFFPIHQLAFTFCGLHILPATSLGLELQGAPSLLPFHLLPDKAGATHDHPLSQHHQHKFLHVNSTHTPHTGNHDSFSSHLLHLLEQLVKNKEQVRSIHTLTS